MREDMRARSGWRRAAALELDPELRTKEGLSLTNRLVIGFIMVSIVFGIIETEPMILLGNERLFFGIEVVITALFSLEYLARIWASVENPRFANRWRYVLSPAALLDLAAVVLVAFTLFGAEGFLLRLARLLRLVRLARLGRFSTAMSNIGFAIAQRKFELFISFGVALVLLLVSSSVLYLIEGEQQPDAFGSIPRAMWWSIATLTTVGYGDVVPLTPLGRAFAALTALTGIGLIAMPTGILAAAFSDAMQRTRERRDRG